MITLTLDVDAPAAAVDVLEDLERRAIAAVLELCSGNISQAARRLGIARSTLQRKIRRWIRSDTARGVEGPGAFAPRQRACD